MLYYVISVVILLAIGVCGWLLRKYLLRKKAWQVYSTAPFAPEWVRILRMRVPLYNRLPASLRERFHRHVKTFLAEKTFTPCGGFRTVNDTMAVAIAGHACVMLCGRDGDCFPSVHSILLYPDSFESPVRRYHPGMGTEIVSTEARDGEASRMGSIVLAWRQVLQYNALAGNGRNLVIHEFAHHVRPSGTGLLKELESGLQQLRANESDSVIDSYGAQNSDEFWAVTVEAFFEASVRLAEAHPSLYRELKNFFALDPANW